MDRTVTQMNQPHQRPAFKVSDGDRVVGTVFQNWQGWCWARWNDDGVGSRAVGLRDTYEAAMAEMVSA